LVKVKVNLYAATDGVDIGYTANQFLVEEKGKAKNIYVALIELSCNFYL